MPSSPHRPCSVPRCPGHAAPRSSLCPTHRLQAEQARGSPSARGYDARWQRLRAWVLREEPDCRACGAPGQDADHVDHILPTSRGGTDDRDNLQRLCPRCHARKTATHDGGFGR